VKIKPVLVDTSVWVGYFRNNDDAEILKRLFEENRLVINDVILAELLPAMTIFGKKDPIEKLRALERLPVFVNWEGLIDLQVQCLKHGVNGIGLPDLMLVQTAIEYKTAIFSKDKHFSLMMPYLKFELFSP